MASRASQLSRSFAEAALVEASPPSVGEGEPVWLQLRSPTSAVAAALASRAGSFARSSWPRRL
eukprot:15256142-Alexandrium_andersonii.AAC.1